MRKGFSLIEVLAVMAIIAVLAVGATVGMRAFGDSKSARPDGKGQTVIGQTLYRARDEVCRSNLGQVRQMVYVQSTGGEEGYPTAITDLRGLPKDFTVCPIGKEPYRYDPAVGSVACPHPGHEKY